MTDSAPSGVVPPHRASLSPQLEAALAACEDARTVFDLLATLGDGVDVMRFSEDVRAVVVPQGAQPVRTSDVYALFGVVRVHAPAASVEHLAQDVRVVHLTFADTPVQALAAGAAQARQASDAASSSGPETSGRGVTVAVVDTGLDASHPGLTDAIAGWRDFVDDAKEPHDPDGHGTKVALALAGRGALPGTAPGARVVGARVLDAQGRGHLAWLLDALAWIAEGGAGAVDIVNLSLGYPCTSVDCPAARAAAVLEQRGVCVIAAGGNEGPARGTICCPAAAPSVLAVAALDEEEAGPTSWSSRGPGTGGAPDKPDVAARGESVAVPTTDGGVDHVNGTSFASPVVAGCAAHGIEMDRRITNGHADLRGAKLRILLRSSAAALHECDVMAVGAGRVTVAGVLAAVKAETRAPPSSHGGVWLGETEEGVAVTLSADQAYRHLMAYGRTGSGKSVLLQRVAVEAARNGQAVVVLEVSKSDFAAMGRPLSAAEARAAGLDSDEAARIAKDIEVRVFTVGSDAGIPAHVPLVGPLNRLPPGGEDRVQALSATASALLAIAGLRRDTQDGAAAFAVLVDVLDEGAQKGADLRDVTDVAAAIEASLPPGAEDPRMQRGERSRLAKRLRNAVAGTEGLVFQLGIPLTPDVLVDPLRAASVGLINVVNFTRIGSERLRLQAVGALLGQLRTWLIAQGDAHRGILLVVDEVGDLAPPTRTTPAKEPLLTLARQARAYRCMLACATQNVSDAHYGLQGCTVLVGRMGDDVNARRLRSLFTATDAAEELLARLPGLCPGQFLGSTTGVKGLPGVVRVKPPAVRHELVRAEDLRGVVPPEVRAAAVRKWSGDVRPIPLPRAPAPAFPSPPPSPCRTPSPVTAPRPVRLHPNLDARDLAWLGRDDVLSHGRVLWREERRGDGALYVEDSSNRPLRFQCPSVLGSDPRSLAPTPVLRVPLSALATSDPCRPTTSLMEVPVLLRRDGSLVELITGAIVRTTKAPSG